MAPSSRVISSARRLATGLPGTLPGFDQDWGGSIDFVRAMIQSIEQAAEERHRAAGTRPLGVQVVKEVHPASYPSANATNHRRAL
jgi:hypothetical protein